MQPYNECNFFAFILLFLKRGLAGFPGGLASDEVQLLLLIGVALSSSLVGTFLVLRRMTMLANALSHTLLFGIVVAFLLLSRSFGLLDLPILMVSALVCGLLTTFGTTFLSRGLRLQEDASIGLIFTLFFALGMLLVTLYSRNTHLGVELVVGNSDALQIGDLKLTYMVLTLNMLVFILLYRGFAATTFDVYHSRVVGFSPPLFSYLLMVQTSLTAVVTFRAVGVLMLLAFVTAPVLIARLWSDRLWGVLLFSAGVGALAAFTGVALSRHLYSCLGIGISTAGLVVCLLLLFYILSLTFRTVKIRLSS